jgi:hypothetical protein
MDLLVDSLQMFLLYAGGIAVQCNIDSAIPKVWWSHLTEIDSAIPWV